MFAKENPLYCTTDEFRLTLVEFILLSIKIGSYLVGCTCTFIDTQRVRKLLITQKPYQSVLDRATKKILPVLVLKMFK